MTSRTESTSNSPALDLDALMEKIRSEVAERKHLAGSTPSAPVPIAGDITTRKWTARELLALPATDFARVTHIAFFGREPSTEEFVRLRDRLLVEGVGRMRILREFRRSPEARSQALHIDGLTRQFVWDRFYWSPPAKFARAFGRVARNLWLLRRHIRGFIDRVDVLERRATEMTAALRNLQSAQMHDRQNEKRDVLRLRERMESGNRNIEEKQRKATENLSDLEMKLVHHWRAIMEHKFELKNAVSALQSGTGPAGRADPLASTLAGDASHALDPLYLSFEDRYRGTRDDIKERQRFYLPRVEEAYNDAGRAPIVDLGCGRGEWLELLSETGLNAHGYDLNRIAVEECRERGIQVDLTDAIGALTALSAESCSVITAFHIIEHLSFDSVVQLLDQSLRVLRPHGILILETPNPANLLVAAERFYLDPTHRNPLPSELTQYLLRARGFQGVEILPLHPVPVDDRKEYPDSMLQLLQKKLYGPQDYGAIGRKSA